MNLLSDCHWNEGELDETGQLDACLIWKYHGYFSSIGIEVNSQGPLHQDE